MNEYVIEIKRCNKPMYVALINQPENFYLVDNINEAFHFNDSDFNDKIFNYMSERKATLRKV